jgi:hypothetical protein
MSEYFKILASPLIWALKVLYVYKFWTCNGLLIEVIGGKEIKHMGLESHSKDKWDKEMKQVVTRGK